VALGLVHLGAAPVWLIAAATLALVVAPALAALSGLAERARERCSARRGDDGAGTPDVYSWTRAQVLRDPRFYAVAPSLLAPPFIITGIVFHQARLVEANGWTLPQFAALFPLFAGAAVIAGLVVGAAVDRAGSRTVLTVFLIPLGLALIVFSLTDALAGAAAAMALMGLTAGGTTVLFGTVWVELYGPAHLGAIRALGVSLMVFATALAPAVLGVLIDAGISLDAQFQALAVYISVCIAIVCRVRAWLIHGPPPSAS